jgi:hypothetical protein
MPAFGELLQDHEIAAILYLHSYCLESNCVTPVEAETVSLENEG